MLRFSRQFKQILFTLLLSVFAATAISQMKPQKARVKPAPAKPISPRLRDFMHLTASAGVIFTFPQGFKETQIFNNEDYAFDYAMEIPGQGFEIWLRVKPQKNDWQNYLLSKNDPHKQTPDPDTAYIALAHAQASTLAEDTSWIKRKISSDVLERYNANAGQSYLLTLPDRRATNRYKYALVLAIEKDHTGTILAVCFTNDKSTDFFKNVSRISRYIKFKP
jgi:hypothetical protein